MKKFNQYSTYYKRQPTEELKEIAFQDDMYHEEARMAAMLELRSRGEEVSDEAYNELEDLLEKNEQVKKEQEKNTISAELPEYYSPAAILGFSIFSIIFGGLLMYANLRKAGKKLEAIIAILISLGFTLLNNLIAYSYGINQWIVILVNVSGALILIEYLWKRYLGNTIKFKRRSLVIPISILVLLSSILFYFFQDQIQLINSSRLN